MSAPLRSPRSPRGNLSVVDPVASHALVQRVVAAAHDTSEKARYVVVDNQAQWSADQKEKLEQVELKMKKQRENRMDAIVLQEQINSLLELTNEFDVNLHDMGNRISDLNSDRDDVEMKMNACKDELEVLKSKLPTIHHDLEQVERDMRDKQAALAKTQDLLNMKQRLLEQIEITDTKPVKTTEGEYLSSLEQAGLRETEITGTGSGRFLKQKVNKVPGTKWELRAQEISEPPETSEIARKRIRAHAAPT